ncbi:Oxoglutarate/iron-dependent dioxygenase, partial [Trinorchestia longiramus]
MFHNRPCGCKGQRSCLLCEKQHGAYCAAEPVSDLMKETAVVYCPLCDLAWPGWGVDDWRTHPHHAGDPVQVEGVKLVLDFVSESEESELLKLLDEVPWDTSQSGRLKQNYGPKCNFKKRKVKLDNFTGYPQFTKFLQDRFQEVELLRDFHTVEQCSLDYTPSRGSSIDPHIDDCWIWGERIPTVSLMSDSVLTLTWYQGRDTRYNLPEVNTYPPVVDQAGRVRTIAQLEKFYNRSSESSDNSKNLGNYLATSYSDKADKTSLTDGKVHNDLEETDCSDIKNRKLTVDEVSRSSSAEGEESDRCLRVVRLPMPRRSLLVLYGSSRYDYEHRVLRDDVPHRRVCITYRELTPTFLSCGPQADIGSEILKSFEKRTCQTVPQSRDRRFITEQALTPNKTKNKDIPCLLETRDSRLHFRCPGLCGGSTTPRGAKHWQNPLGGLRGSGSPLHYCVFFWPGGVSHMSGVVTSSPTLTHPSSSLFFCCWVGSTQTLAPRAHVLLPILVSACSCHVTERAVSFLCTSCHHWIHRRCSRLVLLPTPLFGRARPTLVHPRPLPHGEPETPNPTLSPPPTLLLYGHLFPSTPSPIPPSSPLISP